jgi:glycosyltransferase involved in cell wall biosynthesis
VSVATDDTDRRAGTAGRRKPVRVLFLHTATLPPLGADVWVHARIMESLDQSTHEVVAACTYGPADDRTAVYRELHGLAGVELRSAELGPELSYRSRADQWRAMVRTMRAPFTIARLAWLVRRRRIDVVHTSDRPRDAAAALAIARLGGARCVIHVHVAWGEWMSGMLQRSLRQADALVGVSEFVARTLVDSGHDPARVHAVLNAVQLERWHPGEGRGDARAALGLAEDAPVVLTVSRLFPGKGTGELIKAFAKARRSHPASVLLVAGRETSPGFLDELHALVDSLGESDHVRFLGLRSDVPALMAAADIFAMPSLGEPFGLVFAEAMAMERPVVALDSGGAPEVVEHGVSGLLSPAGDVDAIADHLVALLTDPVRRRAMGAAGRRRVEEHFTTERLGRDMAACYERILS